MAIGIVIAGGRSSRYGPGDKALATVGGTPMLRRVVECAAPLVDRIVVNARQSQRRSFATALAGSSVPVAFAVDRHPDTGPVAGLETALEESDTGAETALVLACDLPLLRTTTLSRLLDRLEGDRIDADAGSPECSLPLVDGRLQPLCGAYSIDALGAGIERLETARHSPLTDVLDTLRLSAVPASALAAGSHEFENVNTRRDVRRVRSLLRSRGRAGSREPCTESDGVD